MSDEKPHFPPLTPAMRKTHPNLTPERLYELLAEAKRKVLGGASAPSMAAPPAATSPDEPPRATPNPPAPHAGLSAPSVAPTAQPNIPFSPADVQAAMEKGFGSPPAPFPPQQVPTLAAQPPAMPNVNSAPPFPFTPGPTVPPTAPFPPAGSPPVQLPFAPASISGYMPPFGAWPQVPDSSWPPVTPLESPPVTPAVPPANPFEPHMLQAPPQWLPSAQPAPMPAAFSDDDVADADESGSWPHPTQAQASPSVVNAPGRPRLVGGEAFIKEAPTTGPQWFWEGIIPDTGITLLCGDPFTYKTVTMLLLAARARTGGQLAGREVRECKVLYLKLEHTDRTYADVLSKAKSGLKVPDVNNVYFLRELDLEDEDSLAYACACADDVGAQVIILDSLRRSHRGDENGSQDAAAHIRLLQVLSDNGKRAVIVIHHTAKGSDSPRGSGDYKAGADATVTVSKSGNIVTLRSENHAAGEDVLRMQVEFSDDSIAVSVVGSESSGGPTTDAQLAEAIIQVCTVPGNLGLGDLRDEVQKIVPASNERIDSMVKKLAENGSIVNQGTKHKNKWIAVLPQGLASPPPPLDP